MTPEEEKRAKAAANKRAYRQRKREELAHQAIIPTDKSNLHELEALFHQAEGTSEIRPFPPGVLYQDNHKDNAQAILADAEERNRRVELIMANYQKDAANMNKLLWHILETLTRMRLEMVDLIGGLRNGK